MTGDKVPWTHSRARAHLKYNRVFGRERKRIKRAARRELRRFRKALDKTDALASVLFFE